MSLERRLMWVRSYLDSLYDEAREGNARGIQFAVSDAIDDIDLALTKIPAAHWDPQPLSDDPSELLPE